MSRRLVVDGGGLGRLHVDDGLVVLREACGLFVFGLALVVLAGEIERAEVAAQHPRHGLCCWRDETSREITHDKSTHHVIQKVKRERYQDDPSSPGTS